MNTFTLVDAGLDRITTLRQEAQHDRLVLEARGHHLHRNWRHLFHFPAAPSPTVLFAAR